MPALNGGFLMPNKSNLTTMPSGVFLVREDDQGHPIAHAIGRLPAAKRRDVLNRAGSKAKLLSHSASAVRSARSLAAIEQRFGTGTIAYDPTGIFGRTSHVVRCANLLRSHMGNKIDKILLDSYRRTLFVVLNDSAFAGEGAALRMSVTEAMKTISATFAEWQQKNDTGLELAVRVGFEPPVGARLVAVDEKSLPGGSVRQLARQISRFRKMLTAAAIGAFAVAAPAAAHAADDTAAVADTNFTLYGVGSEVQHLDHSDWAGLGAELAVPLGHSFGVQVEAGVGTDSYDGFAGHLFWRNPDSGMVGAFASYNAVESAHIDRFGGEAALYLDRFTVEGQLAAQSGALGSGLYGEGDLSFYVTPHFALRAGIETMPHVTDGIVGFEFQPAPESFSGLSLFADGEFGDSTVILAGIKLHFGSEGASLVYQDRHEDPTIGIFKFTAPKHKKHHYSSNTPT